MCDELVSTCNEIHYYSANDTMPPFNLTGEVQVTTNATLNYSDPIGTTYQVLYSVRDRAGNSAVSRGHLIRIVDTIFPSIFINNVTNDNVTRWPAGTPYMDYGASADDTLPPYDLSGQIVVTGVADVDVLAAALTQFYINYTVSDTFGNTAVATRTVIIEDEVAPVITLNGACSCSCLPANRTVVIDPECATFSSSTCLCPPGQVVSKLFSNTSTIWESGVPWNGPGYSAVDPVYNDNLTSAVHVEVQVLNYVRDDMRLICNGITPDMPPPAPDSQIGIITNVINTQLASGTVMRINYTVTDSVGNSAMASRTVTLVDRVAPVIILNGPAEVTVEGNCSNQYYDQWASANDLVSGDISGCISARVCNAGNCSAAVPSANALNALVCLTLARIGSESTITVVYTVTDQVGLSGTTQRDVTFVTAPPTTAAPPSPPPTPAAPEVAPNIIGVSRYVVTLGDNFTLPTCTCGGVGSRRRRQAAPTPCTTDFTASELATVGQHTIAFSCTNPVTGEQTAPSTVIVTVVPVPPPTTPPTEYSGSGEAPPPDVGQIDLQLMLQATFPPTAVQIPAPPTAPPSAVPPRSMVVLTLDPSLNGVSEAAVSSLLSQVGLTVVQLQCFVDVFLCNALVAPTTADIVRRIDAPGLVALAEGPFDVPSPSLLPASNVASAPSGVRSLCSSASGLALPCVAEAPSPGSYTATGSHGAFTFNLATMNVSLAMPPGDDALAAVGTAIVARAGIATVSRSVSCNLLAQGQALCYLTTTHFITTTSLATLAAIPGVGYVSPAAWVSATATPREGVLRFTMNTAAQSLTSPGVIDSYCLSTMCDTSFNVCNSDLVCRNRLLSLLLTGAVSSADASASAFRPLLNCSDYMCGTAFLAPRTTAGPVNPAVAKIFLMGAGISTEWVRCANTTCYYSTKQPSVASTPSISLNQQAGSIAFSTLLGATSVLAPGLSEVLPVVGAVRYASATAMMGVDASLRDSLITATQVSCDVVSFVCTFRSVNGHTSYVALLTSQAGVVSAVGPVALGTGSSQLWGQFSVGTTVYSGQQATYELLSYGVAPDSVSCELGICTFTTSQDGTLPALQGRLAALYAASRATGRRTTNLTRSNELVDVGLQLELALAEVTGAAPSQISVTTVAQSSITSGIASVQIINAGENDTAVYETIFAFANKTTVDLLPVLSGGGVQYTAIRLLPSGSVLLVHEMPLTAAQRRLLVGAGAAGLASYRLAPLTSATVLSHLNHSFIAGALQDVFSVGGGLVSVTRFCLPVCTSSPTPSPTLVPTVDPTVTVAASTGSGGGDGFPVIIVVVAVVVAVLLVIAAAIWAGRRGKVEKVDANSRVHFENPMYDDASPAPRGGVENEMYEVPASTEGYMDVERSAADGGYMDVEDEAGLYQDYEADADADAETIDVVDNGEYEDFSGFGATDGYADVPAPDDEQPDA